MPAARSNTRLRLDRWLLRQLLLFFCSEMVSFRPTRRCRWLRRDSIHKQTQPAHPQLTQALSSHNRSHRPLFTPLLRVMALQRHNSAKRAHACRWEMDAFLGDPISDFPAKISRNLRRSRENLPKSPMFPRKSPEISDVPTKIS